MNAPTARADLLAQIRSEHTRLEEMMAGLSDEQMNQPALDQGWSVKNLLAHITWWEQRMLRLLDAASRGEPGPALLQPGEDWPTAINRVNAATLAASRERTLSDVRDASQRSFQQVLDAIETYSDHDLFDPQGFERAIGRSIHQIIASNTYEHYKEHGDMLHAWIAGGKTAAE